MDDPWSELGIAFTTDVAAIRRAYAARLKSLNVDADPTAFMCLRYAYESAIAGVAECPEWEPPEVLAVVESAESPPDPAAAPDPRAPHGTLAAFRRELLALIERGDTLDAVAALESALAAGVVPLRGSAEFVTLVGECAAGDPALDVGDLAAIAQRLDADDLRSYVEARRWFSAIATDMARGNGCLGIWARTMRRQTRVARALLIPGDRNLLSTDLPALRIEAGNARRHAPALKGRLDVDAIGAKLVELERTLVGQEILAVLLAIVLATLLTVRALLH